MSARVLVCFATVYVVWGSTFLAIRLAVETIPPLLVGGCRHFFGGLFLLLWVLAVSKVRATRREIATASGIGILTAGISNGFLIVAEKTVPSSIAAIAFTAMPLLMLLLNWLWFERVKPGFHDLLAIPLGIVGTLLVVGGGKTLGGASFGAFEVVLLVGCPLFWAFGSLLGRKLRMPSSILFSASVQMLAGGTFLFLLAGLRGDWASGTTLTSLWSLAYLTIFGSLLGYTAFAYLIQNVDPRLVGTYAFMNPVVALVLGLMWGEQILTTEVLLGALLALAAVGTVIGSRLRR